MAQFSTVQQGVPAVLIAAQKLYDYAVAAGDTDQGAVSVPLRLLQALRVALHSLVTTCQLCSWRSTGAECGPIRELRAHWELEPGGVPKAWLSL